MHFYHLIIANKKDVLVDIPKEGFDDFVTSRMAPFYEGAEVAPYEATCSCVGEVARTAAHKAVIKKFGTGIERREDWGKFLRTCNEQRVKDNLSTLDNAEEIDIWQKLYMKPMEDYQRKIFLAHKMKDKPDPTCGFDKDGKRFEDLSGCGGTGKYTTTANPQGYWDYWQIGGRWTGRLDKYDPTKDEANIQTCDLCKGTGKRTDDVGNAARSKDPNYTCNGCDGTGKHVKWPTSWAKHAGDLQPVSKLVGQKDLVPYSMILPDGTWVQKNDSLIWLKFTDRDTVQRAWEKKALALFEKYKDCLALVIDYHN